MQEQEQDFYCVCIHTPQGDETYTVRAASDYAAARMVRAQTGRMAASERDVLRLFTATAEQRKQPRTDSRMQPPNPPLPPVWLHALATRHARA
ncbi:MAG: hypothetical protein H3C49_06920 [Alphaproteobacteria bacterium]|nr:hypothetical protein [Alphaproteobacteria bacterium]